MVEDIHGIGGASSEGERRKTTVIREGGARPEVLAAMPREESRSAGGGGVVKVGAAGSALESIAGAGAAVLAIIAIAGTYPVILCAIGFLALGGALLLGAGGLAAVLGRSRGRDPWGQFMTGGASFEALAGAAAVAGGILSLAGVVPMTLLPVTAIVLGATLILASGGFHFLRETWPVQAGGSGTGAMELAAAGSGAGIIVGLGAVALGVIALLGIQTLTLIEISVLTLGGGMLAQGAAHSSEWASRMFTR